MVIIDYINLHFRNIELLIELELNIAICILNLDNLIYRNIKINFVKMNFNILNTGSSKK